MKDNRPFRDGYRPSRYQSPFGEQRGGQYRALCEDGIVRTATATGEADTFFSIPARVQAYGRTVTGYITTQSYGETNGGTPYEFRAYTYRRNHAVLDGTIGGSR